MIYLDTSVALAQLFAEDRRPSTAFWQQDLASSRLLQYELWSRIYGLGRAASHGDAARTLVDDIDFLELTPTILARALDPFPTPMRTLDALHLASIEFLRAGRQNVELASYDRRMIAAATALKIPLAAL